MNDYVHIFLADKAMKVFLCCLDSKEMDTRCMGASALWALLHNNQRVQTHTHATTHLNFILVTVRLLTGVYWWYMSY